MAGLHIPPELLSEVLAPWLAQAQAEYLAQLPPPPAPDPQYSVPAVADLLGVTAETVRGYLRLDAAHPRHLPHVACTDHERGWRVRLSALAAWQERNTEPAAEAPLRPAQRRAA